MLLKFVRLVFMAGKKAVAAEMFISCTKELCSISDFLGVFLLEFEVLETPKMCVSAGFLAHLRVNKKAVRDVS